MLAIAVKILVKTAKIYATLEKKLQSKEKSIENI